MSDLLGLGASALSAYQTALNTIGENVANAQTAGYTRRKAQLNEVAPLGGNGIVYQDSLEFGGVSATSISRAWDQFRSNDARINSSAAGRTDARQTWYTNVESSLDDGDAGVGASLRTFFNDATTLAANPNDTFGRSSMLIALNNTSNAFKTTATSLANVAQSISDQANLEVTSLNNDLQALAKVNVSLHQAPAGTPTSASLQDERDRLLDSIAGRVDISVKLDGRGVATVTMGGSSQALVDSSGASTVLLTSASDGRLSLQLSDHAVVSPLAVSAGSIAGLVDSASMTADRRAALDTMASDFATAVNSWSAQGRTANGNPGGALLDGSGGAAALKVLTSDPTAIAAASSDGTPNGNLVAISSLRGSDGAEASWASMVAGHSLLTASVNSEATAAATQRDNSLAARDAQSGVDLDQEAADLMRYQQAYSAAGKIIQVARETMQSIMDLF